MSALAHVGLTMSALAHTDLTISALAHIGLALSSLAHADLTLRTLAHAGPLLSAVADAGLTMSGLAHAGLTTCCTGLALGTVLPTGVLPTGVLPTGVLPTGVRDRLSRPVLITALSFRLLHRPAVPDRRIRHRRGKHRTPLRHVLVRRALTSVSRSTNLAVVLRRSI